MSIIIIKCSTRVCCDWHGPYLEDSLALVLVAESALVAGEDGLGEQATARRRALGLLGRGSSHRGGDLRLGGLGLSSSVIGHIDVCAVRMEDEETDQ